MGEIKSVESSATLIRDGKEIDVSDQMIVKVIDYGKFIDEAGPILEEMKDILAPYYPKRQLTVKGSEERVAGPRGPCRGYGFSIIENKTIHLTRNGERTGKTRLKPGRRIISAHLEDTCLSYVSNAGIGIARDRISSEDYRKLESFMDEVRDIQEASIYAPPTND